MRATTTSARVDRRGYKVITVETDPATQRQIVIAKCDDCAATVKLSDKIDMTLPKLLEYASRKRWLIDKRARVATCPNCIKQHIDAAQLRNGYEPAKKPIGRTEWRRNAPFKEMIADDLVDIKRDYITESLTSELEMNIPMPNNGPHKPATVVPLSTGSTITQEERAAYLRLTQPQRKAILVHLDDYFEADKGCYKPGWSDQKIGETINVPFAAVKVLRVDCFGEIKVPSELLVIKGDIEALRGLIQESQNTINRFQSDLDELVRRVHKVEKDYGK